MSLSQGCVNCLRPLLGLGLAGLFLAGHLSVVSAAPLTPFDQYLAGGPRRWMTTPLMTVPPEVTLTRPNVALRTLLPPTAPAVRDLPPPRGFDPPITREISTSSVVTTNLVPGQQSLEGSPAPVPEPSSLALALLLCGAVACAAKFGRLGRG